MWQTGALCEAQWTDGHYYKAKIVDILYNGNFEIIYTEFHEVEEIAPDRIRSYPEGLAISKLNPNDVAEVLWTDGNYYRAKIIKVEAKGTRFVVEFEGFGEVFTAENDQVRIFGTGSNNSGSKVQASTVIDVLKETKETSDRPVVEEPSAEKSWKSDLHPCPPPVPSKNKPFKIPIQKPKQQIEVQAQLPPSSVSLSPKAIPNNNRSHEAKDSISTDDTNLDYILQSSESMSTKKGSRLASLFRRNKNPEPFFIVEDNSTAVESSLEVREQNVQADTVEKKQDIDMGNSPILSEKQKKEKKREKIIEEIIETERFYVNSLEVLVNLWIKPLAQSSSVPSTTRRSSKPGIQSEDSEPILPEKLIRLIFSNVELIFSLQVNLLADLEFVTIGKRTIGQIFSQYAPFLKMYTQYVNNYDAAVSALDRVLADNRFKSFHTFHEALIADPRSMNLDLPSFLIMPVQRTPRYKLLLSELLKYTEEKDPDFKELQSALKKISEVAVSIDEDISLAQNRENIIKIGKKFVPSLNLVTPSRLFVYQGSMNKLSRKEIWIGHEFILFNDLLLVSSSLSWKYVLSLELPLNFAFDYREISGFGENSILIMTTSRSFVCQAQSVQEKDQWLGYFKEVRDELQNKITLDTEPKAIPESLNLKTLRSWTVNDVVIWLYCNDMGDLVPAFNKFSVDGDKFSRITEAVLKTDLGIRDFKSIPISAKKIQDFCTIKREQAKSIEESAEEDDDSRPRFINLKNVKVSNFEKEEARKFTFVVQICWINPSNQSREKTVHRRYEDFEKFEKSIHEIKLSIKLPTRKIFFNSFNKKDLLEKYLQELSAIRSIDDRLASFLEVTLFEFREAASFFKNSKRGNQCFENAKSIPSLPRKQTKFRSKNEEGSSSKSRVNPKPTEAAKMESAQSRNQSSLPSFTDILAHTLSFFKSDDIDKQEKEKMKTHVEGNHDCKSSSRMKEDLASTSKSLVKSSKDGANSSILNRQASQKLKQEKLKPKTPSKDEVKVSSKTEKSRTMRSSSLEALSGVISNKKAFENDFNSEKVSQGAKHQPKRENKIAPRLPKEEDEITCPRPKPPVSNTALPASKPMDKKVRPALPEVVSASSNSRSNDDSSIAASSISSASMPTSSSKPDPSSKSNSGNCHSCGAVRANAQAKFCTRCGEPLR